MKKYEGLKVLYVGSHPLFTEGASAVHMLKMCQAMANLGVGVECVLPGRVKKEKLFSYYGIKTSFRVTSIALSSGAARRPLHGFLSALYARRKRNSFDFVLTRDLIFAWFATKAFGIPTVYDAHHPPVNWAAERIISSFSRSKNLLGMSFNSRGLHDIYFCLGINGAKSRSGAERLRAGGAFEGEHDISSLRERLGPSTREKNSVAIAATLTGEEGLRYWRVLRRKCPRLSFSLSGAGNGTMRFGARWRGRMGRQISE